MGRPPHPLREQQIVALREHLTTGGAPKEFAPMHGVSWSHVRRLMLKLGWHPLWVGEEERAQILAQRKSAK